MSRNDLIADHGRSRYVGRDFDLYFFADEMGKLLGRKPEAQASAYKMVASTNCSFTSNATFETVVDKSTPKAGVKKLQAIDWSFQSDNNVANIGDLKNLLKAHKEGSKIYVILSFAEDDDITNVDEKGSMEDEKEVEGLVEGFCVIQSCTLNAQDGSLATFSMTLEGSGNFDVGA